MSKIICMTLIFSVIKSDNKIKSENDHSWSPENIKVNYFFIKRYDSLEVCVSSSISGELFALWGPVIVVSTAVDLAYIGVREPGHVVIDRYVACVGHEALGRVTRHVYRNHARPCQSGPVLQFKGQIVVVRAKVRGRVAGLLCAYYPLNHSRT